MSTSDFNRDGEVSSSEQAFGLGSILAALSETEAEVKITIKASTGSDEDYESMDLDELESLLEELQEQREDLDDEEPGDPCSDAYPTCSSVNDMKEKNKQEFFGTRDEAIALGYSPCGRCKP